ncbi:FliG C-terminal domain-containing protein [Thalassoglobus sp. JC818]|uniref:FliG C-terminal domain-containing protein n=1 Tax=Thalassoglobus sp. JC818 TaxID=3232136 RepID=UPI00345A7C8D
MATSDTENREERVLTLLRMLREEDRQVLLLSLPEELRGPLLKKIRQEEWKLPSTRRQSRILDEFESLMSIAVKLAGLQTTSNKSHTADDSNPSILQFPQQEEEEVYQLTGDTLLDLEHMNLHQLTAVLEEEQPRTVALICQHLSTRRVADLLNELSSSHRRATVRELANDPHAPAELVSRLTQTTVQQAILKSPKKVEAVNPLIRLADILRETDKPLRREFFSAIEESDSNQALELQKHLYRFNDLLELTDRQVQQVLTRIDSETLQHALFECEPELLEKVLQNLSRRAAATLNEELSYQRPVPKSVCEAAREMIAQTIGIVDEENVT